MLRLSAVVLLATACTRPAPPPDVDTHEEKAIMTPPPETPAPTRADASAAEIGAVAESINGLAVDLYGRLRAGDANLFLSPYSISTALAMTYAGARGATATEMKKTLGFSLGDARLHPAEAGLSVALRSSEGTTLHVANALWVARGYAFLPQFIELTRTHYGARVDAVDFGDEPAARKTINDWVAKQTRDKIRDLIPEGLLDQLTRLVLTNAIYFKGAWAAKFNEQATESLPFHLLDGGTVKAPTMFQRAKLRSGQVGGVQLLELPYVGGQLSMLIALPTKRDGLPAVEKKLSPETLRAWRESLARTKLDVYLPRFTIEAGFALNKTLEKLGMPAAFDRNSADFSGMNGKPDDLYIAAVLHKAFVEVNEEGTEAAAATAVVMKSRGRPAPTPEFRADHPFLFLIQHNETGAILFLGRLANPTAG